MSLKKELLTKHKTPLLAVAGLGILIGVGVLYAWFSASSETNVPKAEEFNRQSANAHIESIKSEANANVAAAQIEAVEAKRQTAVAEKRVAIAEKDTAVNTLNKRTVEYEKFRKKRVVVSSNDLDARERKLLADLSNTYIHSDK